MSPSSTVDLAERVALVTGGASGIGAAAVHALSDAGARVFAADLEGGDVRLDVRDEASWDAVMSRVEAEAGPLDVLVHAAGISATGQVVDTTLDEWRRVLSTNLDGSFLAVRAAGRAMGERGGSVVLIGSASGIRPAPGAAAYSTSKAALNMLVRIAALEFRSAGWPVRVNLLSPAGVRTPLWSSMPFFRDLVDAHGSDDAAFDAMEAEGGGTFLRPEDVARVVLFLASDAAAHVTGAEIPVDDGYAIGGGG